MALSPDIQGLRCVYAHAFGTAYEDRLVHRRSKQKLVQTTQLIDRGGPRRSPATTSSFHQGLPPHNKGLRYPPDPPTVEKIVAVMRAAGSSPEGVRVRGVIAMLWRAGLRISEALALNETDLDPVITMLQR